MIKKIISLLNDVFLAGLGAFTTICYFVFSRGTIDLITKVSLMIIALGGVGKVVFGWKFPLVDNLKFIPKTKPEKYLDLIEDDDLSILTQIINIIKGGIKLMKQFFKWLWANKWTLSGFLVTGLFAIDEYFKLSTQLKLPDDWYFAIVFGLILVLGRAVKGRGFEAIEVWEKFKIFKEETRAKLKAEKQLEKDRKKVEEYERIERLKEEMRKEQTPEKQSNVTVRRR